MDEEIFLKKMGQAVDHRELTALFVDLQGEVRMSHYYEDFCGFQKLKEYKKSFDKRLLEDAIRQFGYVQDTDLKYVRAICYYGKAIAYAYYQTSEGFSEANKWLDKLINLRTSAWTDRANLITTLKTDAGYLKEDINKRSETLFPVNWGKIYLFFILIVIFVVLVFSLQ